MSPRTLVLASASPRRKELLQQLGVDFRILPADIDESVRPGETAPEYVARIAAEKSAAVAATLSGPGWAVLGSDTSVVLDAEVLGKPRDAAHAVEMLSRLGGRWHEVMTAVSLRLPDRESTRVVRTEVEFMPLSGAMCEAYLASGEPWDKAGAYAIQGLGGAFVSRINGSYSNVVGLPLCETWQLLREYAIATGLDGPFDW